MTKKTRARIHKTIFTNGLCALAIRSPSDIRDNTCGQYLTNDAIDITEQEITENVLYMISEAYYAGYIEGKLDAKEAVERLMRESSTPCKPKPKITEIIDYREYINDKENPLDSV